MRVRAVAILIENGNVALIERHRAGRHFFAFPGGGVDRGETVEQALLREMLEETGLQVVVEQRVAEVWFGEERQEFFLVRTVGGVFGTGTGEEFVDQRPDDPHSGTYKAVWMAVSEVVDRPVLPREVARLVLASLTEGWPQELPVIHDQPE